MLRSLRQRAKVAVGVAESLWSTLSHGLQSMTKDNPYTNKMTWKKVIFDFKIGTCMPKNSIPSKKSTIFETLFEIDKWSGRVIINSTIKPKGRVAKAENSHHNDILSLEE